MAKSNLIDFLVANPVDNITKQVIISERLKDYPFTIRAMTEAEYNDTSRLCLKIGRRGEREFDSGRFKLNCIMNNTIEPNFKDAECIKRAGCATPEQLVGKVLLAGEIVELSNQISVLSGFDQDLDGLVDEAKNS